MHKYAFMLVAVAILALSTSLRACDSCDSGSGIVHFKDGLTPNGPVDTGYSRGDTESSGRYIFRDYGPVRVAPPVQEPAKPTS